MTKLNINDYLTYIGNNEDVVYLKTKAFPVNMRLFNSSKTYQEIVLHCCEYIKWLALQHMEGYSKPYGMSGANAAIPFNIIGVVRNRGKENEYCEIMINPKIINRSKEIITGYTNCGSVRLEKPIKVSRRAVIDVEFYDMNGDKYINSYTKENGCRTIQHEIKHNLGVLIIDEDRLI